MKEYKVGDKVKIVSKRGGTWNQAGEMDKYMGQIMTIAKIGEHYIDMVEDGGIWAWNENDFELLNAIED